MVTDDVTVTPTGSRRESSRPSSALNSTPHVFRPAQRRRPGVLHADHVRGRAGDPPRERPVRRRPEQPAAAERLVIGGPRHPRAVVRRPRQPHAVERGAKWLLVPLLVAGHGQPAARPQQPRRLAEADLGIDPVERRPGDDQAERPGSASSSSNEVARNETAPPPARSLATSIIDGPRSIAVSAKRSGASDDVSCPVPHPTSSTGSPAPTEAVAATNATSSAG